MRKVFTIPILEWSEEEEEKSRFEKPEKGFVSFTPFAIKADLWWRGEKESPTED